MRRTADPSDISERLLRAGLELFLRHGYNGTCVEQIAERAGASTGAFYDRFVSKELFAAAIVERYAAWCERSWRWMMRGAPSEPIACIRHVLGQMIDYHERERDSVGCLLGSFAVEIALLSHPCREQLFAAQLAWRERLASLIAEGQAVGEIRRDVDPVTLSTLTWSVWEGALSRMEVDGSVAPLRESIAVVLDRIYRPTAADMPQYNRN